MAKKGKKKRRRSAVKEPAKEPTAGPAKTAAGSAKDRIVAITGIHGMAARRLIQRLEREPACRRLVLIDVRPPPFPVRGAAFHEIDLTEPLADTVVADVLRRERVDTVVHLALREAPRAHDEGAHELDAVGTMYVLNAIADNLAHEGNVARLVTSTTAMVYGASPSNPAYMAEDHPLDGGEQGAFVRDKVDVERQLDAFRRQFGLPVCVLRPAWIVGGGGETLATRLLRDRPALGVLGFDPLFQLLHVDDLVDALVHAVQDTVDGPFNLAAPGVLPLSAILRLAGRTRFSLPSPLAYPLADVLWRAWGIGPGVSLDYLRYLWVVDRERAAAELGVRPRFDVRTVASASARL